MPEHEARRLEDRVVPAMDRISQFIYGQALPIFGEASVVIVPNDTRVECEVPKFTDTVEGPQLQLSNSGADRWRQKLQHACDTASIHPLDLYVSTGVAQLEMILSASASLRGDSEHVEDRRKRVMRTYKALERDEKVKEIASQISEDTEVSMSSVVESFSFDEMMKLNMLRYGIGVGLASLGLKPKQTKAFQSVAQTEAAMSLNKYFAGAANFLIRQAMPKPEIIERVDGVIRLEPPIIEVAAASPMNVTYLFGK